MIECEQANLMPSEETGHWKRQTEGERIALLFADKLEPLTPIRLASDIDQAISTARKEAVLEFLKKVDADDLRAAMFEGTDMALNELIKQAESL